MVGTAQFSGSNIRQLSLDFVGNIPYVAYQDEGYNSKLAVKKFSNSTWQDVSERAISIDAYKLTAGLAADNTPYVVYSGYDNDNQSTVKKYNGTNWETVGVGAGAFSTSSANFPQIAFNGNVPYVAFYGAEASGKIGVKKYNTALSQWEFVGPAGFGDANSTESKLVIDNGTPFVSYAGSGGAVYVKKYNSVANQWEALGTAGVSSGSAYYPSLAVLNNTPYVAITDVALGFKVYVKKYNSATNLWEQVGTAAISDDRSTSSKLAFNGTDLYFAYKNSSDKKVTVKKYNSTLNQWDLVGTAGISVGEADNIDLVFANNTPYLGYIDNVSSVYEAAVKKFDGTNWESFGNPRDGQSSQPFNISLAINEDDLFAAYGSNLYVEKISLATTLPVKLVSFEATNKNQTQVSLNWETASEKSNKFFTISKSQDGKTFETLVNINSKGDSGSAYSTIDFSPFAGTSYYKLSQTDVDGNIEELGVKSVKLASLKEEVLSVYPNPVVNGIINIQHQNLNGLQNVVIYDLTGKQILKDKVSFTNDLATYKLGTQLVKGSYILQVGTLENSTKIVIN